MLSKLSIIFAAEASASAVTSMSSPYASNLACHECIRSGFVYNVPSDQLMGLIPSGGEYGGECCQDMTDTSNCATSIASANTLASDWSSVNPTGISLDLAIARCPTKSDICGSIKEITVSDTTAATQSVIMSGSWSSDDSCTYLMKASCGAPAFTLGGDVTDSDVEVYYMEYAAD